MNKPWEISIYPIIKNYLMDNIDEDNMTDNQVINLTNLICQEIDKKYIIEKRQV